VFDHVPVGAADRAAARAFYASALATLGATPTTDDPTLVEWTDFSIAQAGDDRPVTTRLHVGFRAPAGRPQLEAFHRAGLAAGGRDDGAPGPRPRYGEGYEGAFVLDPDGRSAEAAHHPNLRAGGVVDHVWIRVADLAASRRFYAAVGAVVGFAPVDETSDRVRFSPGPHGGSLTLVASDAPQRTTPVHLAFPAPDQATVKRFHAALTAAGHPDHGAPGLRPEYHPGYFGAFVLDPDGHNIELVHHDRSRG